LHVELPGLKTMAEINAKYKSVNNDDDEADDDDNDDGKVPPPDDRPPLGFGQVRIVLSDVLSYCYMPVEIVY